MRLNTAPENPVTMSGIAHVSEFRIRNSAKAFGILSSGLYANKIRAIIRELGCNAKDSHVAAGRGDLPFDVHLPTGLGPYFAIRDYGTGLTHEQVINIYTTYFESTKTDSNDFIGALGLGSKSPFSYTDNFTVTAIRDGVKGIYSAFINDTGVPSVALMLQEPTDEPAGVEVRFAVENRYDFREFVNEASEVFAHFDVKPNFTGAECNVVTYNYDHRNIVPGVHSRLHGRGNVAVMGNIEYPIDLPNYSGDLKNLEHIDRMGLEIHFPIGEIDFQASREGLQYTKETVSAIARKYAEVAKVLDQLLNDHLAQFTNVWQQRDAIFERSRSSVWSASVNRWLKTNSNPLIERSGYGNGFHSKSIDIAPKKLADEYNMEVRGFVYDTYPRRCRDYNPVGYDGNIVFHPESSLMLIPNHKNEKIQQRLKNHMKENGGSDARRIFLFTPKDPEKEMEFDRFLTEALLDPPSQVVVDAAAIPKIVRKTREKSEPINIMQLRLDQNKRHQSYTSAISWQPLVVPDITQLDQNRRFYYLNLKGFEASMQSGDLVAAKEVYHCMLNTELAVLSGARVYGVRKGDIEAVRAQANWIPLEDLIRDTINDLSTGKFITGIVKGLDSNARSIYTREIAARVDPNSPFRKAVESMDVSENFNVYYLQKLAVMFNLKLDLEKMQADATKVIREVNERYPLIRHLRYGFDEAAVAEYINIVDNSKQDI
jgi:hypothetical protein